MLLTNLCQERLVTCPHHIQFSGAPHWVAIVFSMRKSLGVERSSLVYEASHGGQIACGSS